MKTCTTPPSLTDALLGTLHEAPPLDERRVLIELYGTRLNEMVLRGLPLEWQADCPMERARLVLGLPRPGARI